MEWAGPSHPSLSWTRCGPCAPHKERRGRQLAKIPNCTTSQPQPSPPATYRGCCLDCAPLPCHCCLYVLLLLLSRRSVRASSTTTHIATLLSSLPYRPNACACMHGAWRGCRCFAMSPPPPPLTHTREYMHEHGCYYCWGYCRGKGRARKKDGEEGRGTRRRGKNLGFVIQP